uniref:Large ribosomal subunit protein mL37 n=1 Tax=Hydra vulgaris TaxID=6087 RepID=T2M6H3_HYDVU
MLNRSVHSLFSCNAFISKRYIQSVYTINPKTKAQEQEKQACYLTKTIIKPGLPEVYSGKNVLIPESDRLSIIASIKNCVIETNLFQREEKLKFTKWTGDRSKLRLTHKHHHSLSVPLLLNIFKVIWGSKCSRDAGLLLKNFSYRPDIAAPWERLGQKLQVTGKIGQLVSGNSLLPLFTEDISSSSNEILKWDDVISPFFDLHTYETKFLPRSGFHEGSPYPYPQTLLINNPFNWYTRYTTGQAIFYSFAHSLVFALNNGEEMGKDLKSPIPFQCISFDGDTFTFVCYQLNTLNFKDDSGTKNFAWISSENKLYDNVREEIFPKDSVCKDKPSDCIEYIGKRVSLTDFNRKRLSESFEDEHIMQVFIDGYNNEAANMFLEFIFNTDKKALNMQTCT